VLPLEYKKLNQAIKEAGQIMLGYFGRLLSLEHKSNSADYRTKADVETERAIIQAIESIFPDYNILAEECGEIQKGSAYTFVIDPLDGTNNFVLGVPAFTSSIALLKDGEIIYGVINEPITGNLYYALKGQGAYLNDSPIFVNQENRHEHMTVSYFCDYMTPKVRSSQFKHRLLMLDIRRCLDLWAPALCYCGLASGRMEAIINDGLELYDFAAGKLIAREAGAKITDFSGNPIEDDKANSFIVTNGAELHDFLVNVISELA